MKTFVALAVAAWVACGCAGAWMLGEDRVDLPSIAKGPITLAKAFSDAPERARVTS
jgi:hypothetical protein